MDEGRARVIETRIMNSLLEIEKAAMDLIDGGWSAQIALFNADEQKVAYINLGHFSDEDALAVNVRYNLE